MKVLFNGYVTPGGLFAEKHPLPVKDREARRSEIEAKLDAMLAKKEKMEKYEALAKEDPEARILLDSLRNLY